MRNLTRWFLIVILVVASALSFYPTPISAASETPAQPLLGTDEFGYSWVEEGWGWDSTDVFTDPLGPYGVDQVSGPVDIGFPFKFYGRTYTQAYISVNGLISLGSPAGTHYYTHIPKITLPNNIIAVFWQWLAVNQEQIRYKQAGVAPNRKFIVEWNNVALKVPPFGGNATAWFEGVLFENGDIRMSYFTKPDGTPPSVGIEDESGWYGLGDDTSFLANQHTYRFVYPAVAARLKVTPPVQQSFGSPGGVVNFPINVLNAGDNGSDVFDITAITSTWPAGMYNAAGTTLLKDNDTDGMIDTGAIANHADANIIARITVPPGASTGAGSTTTIELTSSLNTAIKKTVTLRVAVPAPFQQVFKEGVVATQESLDLVAPKTRTHRAITSLPEGPATPSIASLKEGGSLVAWTAWRKPGSYTYTEIQYSLQDRQGNTTRAPARLTDYSTAASRVTDNTPAAAQAPDGKIGLLWVSFQTSSDYYSYIYNMFFAVLDANGALVSGPTNLTNNTVWTNWGQVNPYYDTPTLAATGDNRFVLAWAEVNQKQNYLNNLWYASRSTAGTQVTAPTNFTANTFSTYRYTSPNLTMLNQNKVLLTYHYYFVLDTGNIKYQILNSDCSIFKAAATLDHVGDDSVNQPDGVQLSNGKVLVGWVANKGVGYALLDSSYNKIGASQFLPNVFPVDISDLSVTSDASSRGILTWEEADNTMDSNVRPLRPRLYYALVDGNGGVLTPPMIYRSSVNGFNLTPSYGNIPLPIPNLIFLPMVKR